MNEKALALVLSVICLFPLLFGALLLQEKVLLLNKRMSLLLSLSLSLKGTN